MRSHHRARVVDRNRRPWESFKFLVCLLPRGVNTTWQGKWPKNAQFMLAFKVFSERVLKKQPSKNQTAFKARSNLKRLSGHARRRVIMVRSGVDRVAVSGGMQPSKFWWDIMKWLSSDAWLIFGGNCPLKPLPWHAFPALVARISQPHIGYRL